MNNGKMVPFLSQYSRNLLLKFDATARLELDGRAISKVLVAHLLKLQVSQIESIRLMRKDRRPILRARSPNIIFRGTTVRGVVSPAFADCARVVNTSIILVP
jgi:hypothetical protein